MRQRTWLWFVLAGLLVGPGGCGNRNPLDDPTPLPKRILSEAEPPLQPVKLPEVKLPEAPEVELMPPPDGDPKARDAVAGKTSIEQATVKRPDGRLQLGRIIVDPAENCMHVPGEINQTDGIIEYMAVGSRGKRHESVLMLDVDPVHLVLGAMILGLKAAPLPDQNDPELRIVREGKEEADPAAPVIQPESQVELEVSWLENGRVVTRRAEDLAWNRESKKSMARGAWVYTGGVVYKGVLTAEFDHSFIATWPDRSALFNTPQVAHNPYRGENFGFEANYSVLPPKGTPMRLTIRRVFLPPPPPGAPEDEAGAKPPEGP